MDCKEVSDLFKIVGDNGAVISLTTVTVALAAALYLAGQSAYRSALMLRWWVMGVWAHGAMIKLSATVAGFLYIFKSIDEYLNGDKNWVYTVQNSFDFPDDQS